ncbi:MAG: hypothetical protein LUH10_14860 [Tannerellaceae bacterium]|nr:hypothetical protein [Tannerellaceae bacterium]
MKKNMLTILAFIIMATSQNIIAQSQFSLTPGFFYNGTTLGENIKGFGAILGLEYMGNKDHFFSLELRTKYGYYSFDDGTKWTEDKEGVLNPPKNKEQARLEYSLFSPQIGLIPKFHLHLDDSFSLFIENEFSVGLIAGKFKYKDSVLKKSITEPTLSYNIGVGIEYKLEKCTIISSLGYSTLNFRGKIKKHQPVNYHEYIPNQNACIWINLIFKVPLSKNSS